MIAIIDYGSGNIGSVKNALDYLRIKNKVTDDPGEIMNADKLILPGQGRFGDVMTKLGEEKLDKVMIEEIKKGKLYLGICIGLQILFENSEEDLGVKGLGLIKGKIKRFPNNVKIPQIGWNNVEQKKESLLLNGIDNGYFYFVHSYYVVPEDNNVVLTTTNYGTKFVSGIQK